MRDEITLGIDCSPQSGVVSWWCLKSMSSLPCVFLWLRLSPSSCIARRMVTDACRSPAPHWTGMHKSRRRKLVCVEKKQDLLPVQEREQCVRRINQTAFKWLNQPRRKIVGHPDFSALPGDSSVLYDVLQTRHVRNLVQGIRMGKK